MHTASPLNDDGVADMFAARGVEGARPWTPASGPAGLFGHGVYYLGPGNPPLEVCVIPAKTRPKRDQVRELWRARQGRQASPLLLMCPFAIQESVDAQICGPTEKDLAVVEVDFEQAIGLAVGALGEPNSTAAVRYLRDHTPSEADDFAGLRNQGMFAGHTLRERVRDRPDWTDACGRGKRLRGKAGRHLVEALDFTIEQTNTPVSVLRAPNERARGVAVFLDRGEGYDSAGGRFGESSALSLAFTRADRDNIPFVLLTRGSEIRLYAASRYEGVGRKGQAETYVQADLSLLGDDELGYVPLIFGAEALQDGGTFEQILNWSRDYSAALSDRLRDRVYIEVVPLLAVAVAEQHLADDPEQELDLDALYEETLIVLFRLLFLAYAEDRDLLPYRSNAAYERAALKSTARLLADQANTGRSYEGAETHSLWSGVTDLFEAVDKSNDAWGVPAYNGGLFSSDVEISRCGAAIARLRLTDAQFGPPLTSLLTEPDAGGVVGPVDFRSLSVRDFGTIYEGLLESSLSVAPGDLTLDERGNYIPAEAEDEVVVERGGIYHHNRSGVRKSSASYFTKDFAVEHLLNTALDPALDAHTGRLESLLQGEGDLAAAAFFDFRCADLAMGSGHFLVAAVDHIEKRLAQFLDEHPIPAVEAELDRLKIAAAKHLGDSSTSYEIERRQLLRRQVARRCIYGVDRNEIAVELARLSLWVHTFVPGLPLSFLDHNIVRGDSLTGIGRIEEAVSYLTDQAAGRRAKHGQGSVFETQIMAWLEEAKQPLLRLARASDATKTELKEVRAAAEEALERAEPVRKLFDLICAMRRGEILPFADGLDSEAVEHHPGLEEAEEAADDFDALHFPVAFPEVFLRDQPGFDCIVGNPPWDKVMYEPQQFWVTRAPGLNALAPAERDRKIEELRRTFPNDAAGEEQERHGREAFQEHVAASFEHQGRGHYDFAKLFVERAIALLSSEGRLGYVLPRQSLVLGGWGNLRTLMLDDASLIVVQARNKGGWIFEDVHHSYMVVLLTRTNADGEMRGAARVWPALSSVEQIENLDHVESVLLPAKEIDALSDSKVLPWLDSIEAVGVFDTMRAQSTLSANGSWITGTHDARWDFRRSGPHGAFAESKSSQRSWSVLMTRHLHSYGIDSTIPFNTFVRDLRELADRTPGIVFENGNPRLGEHHPLVVFRHPSRNDDARTIIAGALPLDGIFHNKGYVHGIRHAEGTSPRDLLALLCFLNTYTCDWWARRFVDRHVTAPVINNLRLPDWDEGQRARAAEIAGALLARSGATVLAGGATVEQTAKLAALSDDELLVAAEELAAAGFGLHETQIRVLLEDFSDRGCPPTLRKAILERIE